MNNYTHGEKNYANHTRTQNTQKEKAKDKTQENKHKMNN